MNVVYNLENLGDMLIEMGNYLNENKGEYEDAFNDFEGGLFDKLVQTALFHDACGKQVERTVNEVVVRTDY